MQQKNQFLLLLLLFLFLLSCQTVQYHPAITFTQDEIKSLYVVDVHGRQSPAGAGKIQDCYTTKQVGLDECAVILCKEAKDQPTGLTCEYYVPKVVSDVSKAKATALHSYREQSMDQLMASLIENGSQDAIAKKCSEPTITCYLNSRYYPSSKPPSTAKLATLLHKKTYFLKNGDKLEFSVFKD